MNPFSLESLLAMLNVLKGPRTFFLDTFFNSSETFGTETVKVDIRTAKRRMAPFTNPRSKATNVEREGFTTKIFTPAYIKPEITYVPSDLRNRQAGQLVQAAGAGSSNSLSQLIAQDLADLQDQITRCEEWMAARALLDHTVDVVGEGYNETVNFLFDASHKVVLAGNALWSDAASDPYHDIMDWRRTIAQDSGRTADVVVVGSDVAEALANHVGFQARLDRIHSVVGRFDPRELPDGVTLIGSLNNGAVALYSYDEWFIDPVDDLEKPMMDTQKVIVGSRGARATRLYGAIQDFDASGTGVLMETRAWPKTYQSPDPSEFHLMLQSAPLPAPIEVNAFVSAAVLA